MLKEFVDSLREKRKKKINRDFYDYNYIGLEHMPRGSTSLLNWRQVEIVKGNKTLFEKYDILFEVKT